MQNFVVSRFMVGQCHWCLHGKAERKRLGSESGLRVVLKWCSCETWVSHRLTGWGLLFLWLLPFTQNVAQQINSSPCSCLVWGSICFQILLDVFLIQHPSCGTLDVPIFFIFSFFGRGVTNVRYQMPGMILEHLCIGHYCAWIIPKLSCSIIRWIQRKTWKKAASRFN